MKTISAKPHEVQHAWYVIDAKDKVLGRMASRVAGILRGKHKPIYTPHVDTGDFVIIVNASQIKVTGKKTTDKKYFHHTGFPGGIKEASFEDALEKNAARVIELAIKGMLPKGPLGRDMFRKLKVYAGAEHPHSAQQPIILDTDSLT